MACAIVPASPAPQWRRKVIESLVPAENLEGLFAWLPKGTYARSELMGDQKWMSEDACGHPVIILQGMESGSLAQCCQVTGFHDKDTNKTRAPSEKWPDPSDPLRHQVLPIGGNGSKPFSDGKPTLKLEGTAQMRTKSWAKLDGVFWVETCNLKRWGGQVECRLISQSLGRLLWQIQQFLLGNLPMLKDQRDMNVCRTARGSIILCRETLALIQAWHRKQSPSSSGSALKRPRSTSPASGKICRQKLETPVCLDPVPSIPLQAPPSPKLVVQACRSYASVAKGQ